MITVKIKIPPNIEKITDKVREAAYSAFREVVDDAKEIWKSEVGKKLKTTREDYLNAIESKMIGDDEAEIFLKPNVWIANALEGGLDSYNIRERVMQSKKFTVHPERFAALSPEAKRKAFVYLARVGRLGQPATPYSDVGFRNKGSSRQGKPDSYRRISKNLDSGARWQHPGFKPKGSGGLAEPLREEVKRQVEEKAPEIFNKILSKVTA